MDRGRIEGFFFFSISNIVLESDIYTIYIWHLLDGVFLYSFIRKSEKYALYKSMDIFPDSRKT